MTTTPHPAGVAGEQPDSLTITRAIGPMLRELTACRHLPDDDPRRVAALAEKRRLLELIEQHDAPG